MFRKGLKTFGIIMMVCLMIVGMFPGSLAAEEIPEAATVSAVESETAAVDAEEEATTEAESAEAATDTEETVTIDVSDMTEYTEDEAASLLGSQMATTRYQGQTEPAKDPVSTPAAVTTVSKTSGSKVSTPQTYNSNTSSQKKAVQTKTYSNNTSSQKKAVQTKIYSNNTSSQKKAVQIKTYSSNNSSQKKAAQTKTYKKKAAKSKKKKPTPKINIKKRRITIKKGTKKKLAFKVKYVSKKKIRWSSSNKKVATVNSKGVVKVKSGGKCIITARIKGTKIKDTIIVKGRDYYYLRVKTTGYCNCSRCAGPWAGCRTASGKYPRARHTIAVDRKKIKLGTRVKIGKITYVAEDTGSGVRGRHIDIFYKSHRKASRHGVKWRTAKVYF